MAFLHKMWRWFDMVRWRSVSCRFVDVRKFRSSNPDKGVRIRQLLNPIRSIPKTTMTTTMGTMLLSFNDRRVAPCSASCRDTNKPVPTQDHGGAIKRRRNARNVMRLKRRHTVMTTHHENHGGFILSEENHRKPRRHQPNKGSKQATRGERCCAVPSDTSIANSDPTFPGWRLWLEDNRQQSTGMIDEICFDSNEGGIRRGALSFRQFISALEGFYSQSIRNDESPLGCLSINRQKHLGISRLCPCIGMNIG